jgi:hypothetical protein
MTQATMAAKKVALDALQDKIRSYQAATDTIKALSKNMEEWKAHREKIRQEIELAMGTAESGTVNGREVVTHTTRDSFAHAEFRKAYPDIAEVFMVTTVKKELNWRQLLQVHPDIATPYQTRMFSVDL